MCRHKGIFFVIPERLASQKGPWNKHKMKAEMDVRVGPLRKLSTKELMAFELWCWTGLLRVPWTARRSNQSIPKEISPEYSLEGLMLKLKLQYSGPPMRRTDSLEKTLMLGTIAGRRKRGRQRMGTVG